MGGVAWRRAAVAAVAMLGAAAGLSQPAARTPADWVDPRIGNPAGRGNTVIGPTLPHGSIHPSPDTVDGGTSGHKLGKPVRGVCSLDAVASDWASHGAPGQFAVVSDARRREVYWALYNRDGSRVEGPFVTAPGEVPRLLLAGPGAALVGTVAGPDRLDAGVLARAATQLRDAGLEPLYLRRPDAEVSKTRKSTIVQPKLVLVRRGR